MMKKNFPYFAKNKKSIYLDTAASALKVSRAINEEKEFISKFGVNVGRGMYYTSLKATELYEEARKKVAIFLNAEKEEIIFTAGTTDSLNIIARSVAFDLDKESEVIITKMEHNSSFLPWYEESLKKGFKLKEVNLDKNLDIDLKHLESLMNKNTKVFITTLASNILGNKINIEKINEICHKNNVLVIVDAAQEVAHNKIDVKKLDIDALAFSGHKLYATNGIGVLYVKKEILFKLKPSLFGGGAIDTYEEGKPVYKKPPYSFEPGTPKVAQAISLASSIDFLNEIGFEKIRREEKELIDYTINKMSKINGIILINKKPVNPIFSFLVKGVHPHDVACFLAEGGIEIRAGFHCAERLLRHMGYDSGCLRASVGIYNDKKDIDKFIDVLLEAVKFFKRGN